MTKQEIYEALKEIRNDLNNDSVSIMTVLSNMIDLLIEMNGVSDGE